MRISCARIMPLWSRLTIRRRRLIWIADLALALLAAILMITAPNPLSAGRFRAVIGVIAGFMFLSLFVVFDSVRSSAVSAKSRLNRVLVRAFLVFYISISVGALIICVRMLVALSTAQPLR
jgi:hypothetical protein